MPGSGVFREDCLSPCCLWASSAAAEPGVSDEGTRRVSDLGRHSFGYFSFAVERKVTRHQAEIMAIRTGKPTSYDAPM